MRIFRYQLEITDYQQLQPVWPGRVLSVRAHTYSDDGLEIPLGSPERGIDLWATAADDREIAYAQANGSGRAPVLGVWIVGTGAPMPPELAEHDALFHDTVDLRPHLGAWHVFSAVVGQAAAAPPPLGQVASYKDLVDKVRARHIDRRTP